MPRARREREREDRGVLPRDDGVMRVFVAVSDKIMKQRKRYVGCHFGNGRLHPRVLSDPRCVFYYPEFWDAIGGFGGIAKDRTSEIGGKIRYHAARIKEEADDAKKMTGLPGAEKTASMVSDLWTRFKKDRSRSHLESILKALSDVHTDVQFGPHTGSQGYEAFFLF